MSLQQKQLVISLLSDISNEDFTEFLQKKMPHKRIEKAAFKHEENENDLRTFTVSTIASILIVRTASDLNLTEKQMDKYLDEFKSDPDMKNKFFEFALKELPYRYYNYMGWTYR